MVRSEKLNLNAIIGNNRSPQTHSGLKKSECKCYTHAATMVHSSIVNEVQINKKVEIAYHCGPQSRSGSLKSEIVLQAATAFIGKISQKQFEG